MKTSQNFGLLYFLLIICQVIMSNFTNLGPYVMLSMLPAMILCIPTSISTAVCMIVAFASGLAVDWLSEGLLGLNAAAAVLVAILRKGLIRFFLGEDIITRNDSFSIRKNGMV
jgi:rod shape-determining protein MreD